LDPLPDGQGTGAQQGWVEDGSLTPLALEAGDRVLEIGCGAGGSTLAMAQRGALMTALEPDEEAARVATERTAHLAHVSIERSTLRDWLGAQGRSKPEFDLIVFREADTSLPRGDVGDLVDVIEAAAVLLGAEGALLLNVRNPWGLTRLLSGSRTRPSERVAAPLGRAALQASLAAHGLTNQRWLISYPGHGTPQVIVDAGLWGRRGGDRLAKAMVRRPVSDMGDGRAWASDPVKAFQTAIDEGRATEVADTFLVVASRGGSAARSKTRAGLLWLLPPVDRRRDWRLVREVLPEEDGWSVRPVGSCAAAQSGPLAFEPLTFALPIGVSAEDLIVSTVLAQGPLASDATGLLRTWWRCARAVIDASPRGHLQYDVLPRHFMIASDGEWRHVPQDLTWRFPLPSEVLAYRGLRQLITEGVLPRGRLMGLPITMSVDATVRAMMDSIDVRSGEEFAYLWMELEADVAARTSGAPLDRSAYKTGLLTQGAMPLWRHTFDLPLDQRLRAVTSGEHAAEAAEVWRELDAQSAVIRAERRELATRNAEADGLTRELEQLSAEADGLTRELEQLSAEVDGLTRELEQLSAEVDVLRGGPEEPHQVSAEGQDPPSTRDPGSA
jgi:SAM-dependent methyltransferase